MKIFCYSTLLLASLAQAQEPLPDQASVAAPIHNQGNVISAGRFGNVTLYTPKAEANEVVLFLSGDGGWNAGVVSMAESLRAQGALVAGIDVKHYLAELNHSSERCVSLAQDLEHLSLNVQQKAKIKNVHHPLLAGFSSGATLVYGALVQAPGGTFKGGLSLGFCPDLALHVPLCKGEGLHTTALPKGTGVNLDGVNTIGAPWTALQGEIDQVCNPPATQQFVNAINNASVVMLPHVGHGYSVEKNWMPQYMDAYRALHAGNDSSAAVKVRTDGNAEQSRSNSGGSLDSDISELPLTEITATEKNNDNFVIFISGDGGWVGLDREVAAHLQQRGYSVVGWDSLRYFWNARTPEEAAHDLTRVISHYETQWHKSHVIVMGYSQGADVLPFMVNRLSPGDRAKISQVSLLGLSDSALFEFHFSNWLGAEEPGLPTGPEVEKLGTHQTLCVYGESETDDFCPHTKLNKLKLPGGHHFGGDYDRLAQGLLANLAAR